MKRNLIMGLLVLAGFPFLNSCNKDEKPKPAGINFDLAEEDVLESDGTTKSFHPKLLQGATGRELKARVTFDKPLAETAVISYTIGGTATKNSASVNGDYEINGTTLTIEKGATEAFITFTLFEDFSFEVDGATTYETIIFTLDKVVAGPAVIGDQKSYTLKVNEDDALVTLEWIATNADLDLFIWLSGQIINGSTTAGAAPEGAIIPGGFPNGTYGLSYTYYEGTAASVPFTATIQNLGGTVNTSGSEASFTATYTLDNVNRYDSTAHPNYKGQPVIVQTMKKTLLNYTNVTQITVPPKTSGSRIGISNDFPYLLKGRERLPALPFTKLF
jgi:hypothetical protein